jgi:transposase-like protein
LTLTLSSQRLYGHNIQVGLFGLFLERGSSRFRNGDCLQQEPKRRSADEKVAIVGRYLFGGDTLEHLCQELALPPGLVRVWVAEFLKYGAAGFSTKDPKRLPD